MAETISSSDSPRARAWECRVASYLGLSVLTRSHSGMLQVFQWPRVETSSCD